MQDISKEQHKKYVEESNRLRRYRVNKPLDGQLHYAKVGDSYFSSTLYDSGYNILELVNSGHLTDITGPFPFEKYLVGKNRHSVLTICPACHSQGINGPLEKACGDCGYIHTRTYYDAESIHNLLVALNEGKKIADQHLKNRQNEGL